MKKLFIVFVVLCCVLFPLSAQQRGGDYVGEQVEVIEGRTVAPQGKQWAFFISTDVYLDKEWGEPLINPEKDTREIRDILLAYYHFDPSCVIELYNYQATRVNIIRKLQELQNKTEPNDSVFIFHAGHGVSDESTGVSAWIPYDGSYDSVAQLNWVHHYEIRRMLRSLNARHVFLISDSCYSGDLLDNTRGTPETVRNYPAAYDRVSRQVMSSGASGEQVNDVSEFAARLKTILTRTETPYVTPDFLLSQIKEEQTGTNLYTIPVLGIIPPHEIGGSFIFFRKNPRQTPTVTGQPASPQGITPVVIQPPVVQPVPGTRDFFIGTWVGYPELENSTSLDEYEITFFADGRCNVKITNDTAEQETTGRWNWENSYFTITANFRNATITYQRIIDWSPSIVRFNGENGFNVFGRASTNGSMVRFTFYRSN